jgi:hypothetical protein
MQKKLSGITYCRCLVGLIGYSFFFSHSFLSVFGVDEKVDIELKGASKRFGLDPNVINSLVERIAVRSMIPSNLKYRNERLSHQIPVWKLKLEPDVEFMRK